MPSSLTALVIVLILATTVFIIVKSPSVYIVGDNAFCRRRNTWLAVTVFAFISNNFWIYAFFTSLIVYVSSKKDDTPLALYFSLLFAVPVGYGDIGGLGIINYLFSLSHQRILSLVILLPLFFKILKRTDRIKFGNLLPDKLILGFIILFLATSLRDTSVTHVTRLAIYQFTDIFLPYYVISRSLRSLDDFKNVLTSYLIAVIIIGVIGLYEIISRWLLYTEVINSLNLQNAMTEYLMRSGNLRAVSTSGHSIALGFLIATAIGIYPFIASFIHNQFLRLTGISVLFVALLAPLSRGPWIGALSIVSIFILTGKRPLVAFGKLITIIVLVVMTLNLIPTSNNITKIVPFIGQVDSENITYRERLIENSIIVIKENPVFGTPDFLEHPKMKELIQGQGIIDIVNSYVGISLKMGLFGLALFLLIFLSILKEIKKSTTLINKANQDIALLGRSLFSTTIGILIIIFTVSSISVIPWAYWSFAGLGVAYTLLVKKELANKHRG